MELLWNTNEEISKRILFIINMNHKKAIIFLAIVWVAIIGGFVAMKEFTIQTGEEVLLKTVPVDPRDLFRGDYVILSYDISRFETDDTTGFDPGRTVYALLDTSEKYAQIISLHTQKPDGLFMKGRLESGFGDTLRIAYGIESYFVPENKGYIIEKAQRKGDVDVSVKVAVDSSGNSVITSLLIDGEDVSFDDAEE